MTSRQGWRVALTGRYDDEVVELLIRSIAHDSLVVDVGASLGLYTVPLGLATMALGGELLAIDPLERNCRVTAANVEANGLTGVVRIARCAVGASAGIAVLHSEPGGAGNAAVVDGVAASELAWHDREGGLTHEERVDVERLDDLVRPLGRRVSLIKIDVEGLEFEVLDGATRTVHEDRPVIYAEMSAEWLRARGVAGNALHRWLAASRYRCFEVRVPHIDRWSDRRRVELREIADDREREGHDLLLVPGESRSEFAVSLSSPSVPATTPGRS